MSLQGTDPEEIYGILNLFAVICYLMLLVYKAKVYHIYVLLSIIMYYTSHCQIRYKTVNLFTSDPDMLPMGQKWPGGQTN